MLAFVFGISMQTQAQTSQKVTVQINHQKAAVKNKLTIKFVSLLEDSRCPRGTQCIQAGAARIQIEASGAGGAAKMFELKTNASPKSIYYRGYEITLTDVNPAPANNIRINRSGYTATFSVRKSGGRID